MEWSFSKILLPECLQESQPQLLCENNICYWNDARAKLTKEYSQERLGYATCDLKPKLVVTHYTENTSVAATDNTFRPLKSDRSDIRGVNTSCHYIVGPNGDIHKRMDECQMARHVIGLNEHAVCIENVALDEQHLTSKQVEADAKLIHYLTSKFKTIDTMIGHSESESLNKIPSLYRNLAGSPSGHTDPGPSFLTKLRKNLAERCGESARVQMPSSSSE